MTIKHEAAALSHPFILQLGVRLINITLKRDKGAARFLWAETADTLEGTVVQHRPDMQPFTVH